MDLNEEQRRFIEFIPKVGDCNCDEHQNMTTEHYDSDTPQKADCSSAPCSPPNLFETVIDEIKSKHSTVEEMMLDRDPQQKVAMDDFNCYLFNNVLFLIDQFKARVDEARKIATAYRDDEYFDEGDMVRLPWESPANAEEWRDDDKLPSI